MSTTSSATDRIFDLEIDLLIGSRGVFSDAELERGWTVYGAELVSSLVGRSVPGTRPWGYWKFDLKEQEPDEPALRLAERGLLRDDEVAAIAARAKEGRRRGSAPPPSTTTVRAIAPMGKPWRYTRLSHGRWARADGGENCCLANLRPSCARCNRGWR